MITSPLRVTKVGLAGLLGGALMCSAYAPASATERPLLATPAATSNPTILTNGGFALPDEGRDAITYLNPPSVYKAYKDPVKTIPGWVIGSASAASAGGVGVNLDYLQPPAGEAQNVILGYNGPGTISQAVKTVPGATYLLSWYGAGYPDKSATEVMHVLWGSKVVAAPSYFTGGHNNSAPGWRAGHVVVTAASTASTLEFTDATNPPLAYYAMVGEVSLSGDATLYLPTTATVAPTGKILAVVRTATGQPLVDPALVVKLYGTYKETSYAPAATQLMASGTVRSGQVTLQLHLHAAMAAHAIPAYATLNGPGFTPVTDHLKIKVS